MPAHRPMRTQRHPGIPSGMALLDSFSRDPAITRAVIPNQRVRGRPGHGAPRVRTSLLEKGSSEHTVLALLLNWVVAHSTPTTALAAAFIPMPMLPRIVPAVYPGGISHAPKALIAQPRHPSALPRNDARNWARRCPCDRTHFFPNAFRGKGVRWGALFAARPPCGLAPNRCRMKNQPHSPSALVNPTAVLILARLRSIQLECGHADHHSHWLASSMLHPP